MTVSPADLPHDPVVTGAAPKLGWSFAAIVFFFSLLLFGYASFSGKPLSLHEARLPQVAREMLHTGHFSFAKSGDRPWVERPPLPQWITALSGRLASGINHESVARMPVAIVGAITCVLLALSAARLFGQSVGTLSGLVLATTYEFYLYATLAEDEVYLAALVLLCIYAYLRASLDGRRMWMVAFFVSLGLTNLVRGPLVGMGQIGSVLLAFHLAQTIVARNWRNLFAPIGPTLWLIGLAGAAFLGGAWYVWVGQQVPEFYANLRYDLAGPFGHDPWWYYITALLWTLLPWSIFSIIGIIRLCRTNSNLSELRGEFRPSWFVLCWAIAPVLLMSIPARKHHHYLVPVFAGWAILGAIGLAATWQYLLALAPNPRAFRHTLGWVGLPGVVAIMGLAAVGTLGTPIWAGALLAGFFLTACVVTGLGFQKRDGRIALSGVLLGFLLCGSWYQTCYFAFSPKRLAERTFAQTAESLAQADAPVFIVAKQGLDFFTLAFYVRPDAKVIHNLTWLGDERIAANVIYVITRFEDQAWIESNIGTCELIHRAPFTRREPKVDAEGYRWALFRVTYKSDVTRYAPVAINAMQAIRRPDPLTHSPYLGPAPESEKRATSAPSVEDVER